jgi:hypothetical protein
MIPDDLRLRLVEAVLKTPLADSAVGRNTFLGGIPGPGFLRNPDNASGDVMILVLQLEEMFGPAGEWRLLQFIDNAAASVAGTELSRTLRTIRHELETAARPRKVSPANTAQVHLFDLRPPVMMCVGQLPYDGGVSGFVLPGATPRLLQYFCDSLKHRGAEFQAWTRDRIAPIASLLVIGPLHTTVSVATENARRVQRLLAVKHVVWPAYVETMADADALWQALQEAIARPSRHMVVVFGMPDGQSVPDGMRLLPPPRFTAGDVATWASDIAAAKAWRAALTERWTTTITMGYPPDTALPVEVVYDRLERYHQLVNEHGDDDHSLLQALLDLEQLENDYAATEENQS